MEAVDWTVVLLGLAWSHHHSSSDGVDGVWGETGSDSDSPTEEEVNTEVISKVSGEDGLDGVVDAEVKTTINDDTNAWDNETSVKTSDSVSGEGLLVDVDESTVLFLSSLLGRLKIVGKSGSGVVERVDEEQALADE